MSFTLKSCLQRSFLMRLLQTTGLSLALMTASAAGVHAEDVTVQGANGANGLDGNSGGLGGNGDGGDGGDGGPATAVTASGTSPPNNATAIGGSGGNGGNLEFDVSPGDRAGNGGGGGLATAIAVSGTSPLNNATAIGGSGGNGGSVTFNSGGFTGAGGSGGAAMATAGTTIIFGSASADAAATGGIGGDLAPFDPTPDGAFTSSGGGGSATASATGSTKSGNATVSASAVGGNGGSAFQEGGLGGGGGLATASAAGSSGSGNATVSASAVGGNGDSGYENGGSGAAANAGSSARTTGSGDALSSASATGGEGQRGGETQGAGGSATAMADASAAGGGKAIATAVATTVLTPGLFTTGNANATSNAETVNGAMAQALSTVVQGVTFFFPGGQVTSTAKTSLAGVSVQSTAAAPVDTGFESSVTATTDAIAQGGSGQTAVDPSETAAAIAIVLPDKAYAATLIGSSSNVADALLGPGDKIFGTAILATVEGSSASSTFDFSFRGDLILGVIADGGFDIIANGIDILSENVRDNSVINLGFLGPNIDLTIEGDGVFALGGAVPEQSTWAMMLVGFAGLGFAGYRSTGGRCSSQKFTT